jgi:hypothetical protein
VFLRSVCNWSIPQGFRVRKSIGNLWSTTFR